jgi:hypothetical protein
LKWGSKKDLFVARETEHENDDEDENDSKGENNQREDRA